MSITFDQLGLCAPILKAVAEQGYTTPSPIQAQAIPAVLKGQDVMAAAQTGTGKTAGFTLPILERLQSMQRAASNHVKVLVLTPTRELAAQIEDNVKLYSAHLPVRSTVVFGGVGINPQMMRLRKGVEILVATPGRLLDLHSQNAVKFNQLEILVLDEADRMLDMGFIHDIKRILKLLPDRRQNLLFSATFSDEIRALAKGLVHNPLEIDIAPRNTTVETVTQWLSPVDKKQKPALLIHLIKEHNWHQVLVFSRTKHGANKLAKQLEDAGLEAAAIHGNKSQNARTKALADFKANKIRVLVATDIAARGIDIDQLPQVVNVDLPNVPEDYVHRIGRTGRAGAEGQAVSLVCADELKELKQIERLTKQVIERKLVPGFEPVNPLPVTQLDTRPIKPNRPKKPKSEHHDGNRGGSAKKMGDQPKPRRRRRPPANRTA
ncbi:DEAD/DEAH box helicase [Simiduia agarivorans]|uniref:ATP-dependent RNA helicase RhlE n=1 Tax=Simiduia agarivorans (strain DSM 21679 / JCM 13881 / BCRC 17597 / SA1) TaxID=1117647 RepID=K4KRJ0_SIMAS|nr:DEAD/DEAH box helicase [Simiduia agarivorans]AFV00911.1 DEAD/DEAH box helicase [Simiduia agarivorans SA1 = DSM 21679]